MLKKEIALYIVFGILTTAISIGTYTVLLFLNWHYIAATTVSWTCAVLFSYVTNRQYVFSSKADHLPDIIKESFRFVLSRIGTWGLETVSLVGFIEMGHFDQMFSKYIVTVIAVVANYILSKWIVFQS